MKWLIFQLKNWRDHLDSDPVNLMTNYIPVALVEADHNEEVWRLTNSIDSYWGENAGVTMFKDKCRSTMTGDVFLCLDTMEYHRVEFCGFSLVSPVTPEIPYKLEQV